MRFKGRAIALAVSGFLIGGALTGATVWAAGSRTAATGRAVERVAVVRSSQIFNTSTTTYTTIPGATARITVPSGERALLIARFTTQVDCTVGDGSPSGACMARILSNAKEMAPASGGSKLDTVAAGRPAGVKSGALDRSLGPVGPGTYNIKVQVRVTNAKMIVEVTDWHLTVERVRA
jgi:hypothetical protein